MHYSKVSSTASLKLKSFWLYSPVDSSCALSEIDIVELTSSPKRIWVMKVWKILRNSFDMSIWIVPVLLF